MFLGLCDEGEASATCSVKVAEQTALTAINEDAGTVTFGTKVIQLRNVVKVKSTTERVKLRALISGIAREGTITNIGVRPGEQYFVATQLGEPLSKRNNMLFYRGFTLQTDAIGTVNHIYYPPREAGLSQVTLGWLEKQLGTAAVSKNGSYSVSVIIRSRFNLTRLTFTAPNRNSRPEVITLSGSLPDETRDYELSAVSFNA
jgi:hypothetical protein